MRRTFTERRAHFGRQGLSRCRAGQPTGSASGTSCSSLALKQPLLYKAPGPNPGCKEISPAVLKLTCNTSSVPVIWETDPTSVPRLRTNSAPSYCLVWIRRHCNLVPLGQFFGRRSKKTTNIFVWLGGGGLLLGSAGAGMSSYFRVVYLPGVGPHSLDGCDPRGAKSAARKYWKRALLSRPYTCLPQSLRIRSVGR